MAIFKPFKSFRPNNKENAGLIAAKPYDVLNSEEAREEAKDKPLSFLHVGKPEIDLDPTLSIYDQSVYEKGRDNLQKLIKDGFLIQDSKPCFYLYAQTMGGRTQYGFVGCCHVDDYWDDNIKKHEFTRKQKEDDRCQHVRITNAHTGPIFLTYKDNDELDLIINAVKENETTADFTDELNVRHQCWLINDDITIRQIEHLFGSIEKLYVADGHHRSAAAAIVGREHQKANPNHTGNEEYNLFLSVLFPASHLHIMDYNRVVKDLNNQTEEEFLEAATKYFTIEKQDTQFKPKNKSEFGVYLGKGKWYKFVAKSELIDLNDPIESLDVSYLQKYLLDPILGIKDQRTDNRIDFIGGIRGIGELERRVDNGEMALAIALHATSIAELMKIADSGNVMPPKSTWFEPKLKDGLFVHFLD